jgi:hypothetical protein
MCTTNKTDIEGEEDMIEFLIQSCGLPGCVVAMLLCMVLAQVLLRLGL